MLRIYIALTLFVAAAVVPVWLAEYKQSQIGASAKHRGLMKKKVTKFP